ncbi:MAG: autotransporter domain-containing protein [Alphaproteobacteria bacterium]|nr:autotransporter domain-containing protein [Alphaproteobacteria bacterium]
MKLDIKKLLLAGTAIVAVGAAGATAAKAADFTLTGNTTWGAGDTAGAAADDNVNLDGNDLAVNESNNTQIGAITDTNATPDGNVTINSDAGDNASLAVTIGSVTLGTGNFSVLATEGTNTNADATDVTVTGAISTTGNVVITAGDQNAGDNATLNVAGNISATTITIDDDNGAATLVLNGTASGQTIAGAVNGDGDITINNTHASGVTFTGANTNTGTITMNAAGANQAVTFTGDVSSDISLGDNVGTDTKTATFGGAAATTISGDISGGGAADTVALNFVGGDVVTLSGAATSNIDTVSVSGNTTLDSDAAITATTITIASGSKLDQGAGAINADIANSGTIQSTAGAAAITGDITGTGALDIDTAITLDGSVTQGSADIAGVTLTNDSGTVYNVGTTNFSAAGTLAFDNTGRTVTGNFTSTNGSEGTITIADGTNTTAFVGNLGTADKTLLALTIAGTSNNIVTTTGNLYVDGITTTDAGDEIQFLGATGSTQVVSGTIDDDGANNQGIIRVGNDTLAPTVQFDGIIGGTQRLNTLEVNENATAFLNANASFDTAVTVDTGAKLRIGAGDVLTVQAGGAITNNGTIQIDVADADGTLTATDFGQIATADDALDTDGVIINVTGKIGIDNDLDPFGDITFDEAKALVDNSALYVFTVDATHNIDVTQASTASITNNAAKKATADNLLAATATGELLQVQNAFVSAGSADVNNVLEAAASDVSAGAVVGGVQVAGHTTSVNNQRLAAVRSGEETGMSAGQMMSGLKAWIQGFGATGEQDERDNVSGYDVDSVGFALGLDTENVAEDLTVGVSVAYANTDVESDAISNAETEIDSYQIALYGDYDLSNTAFITAQLAYMWSDNETTRNPGGVSSLVANGDYDSDTFIANATLGNDYHMGHGSLVLTPSVSANYVHYSADSYTETGAGTANLSVNSDSMNIFELGLGVNAEWSFEQANGSWFKPSVGVGVRHDLIGDEYQATNQFAGSTTSFEVEGYDPAQTTFDAGVGFKYYTTDSWTISADYNYEFKSDFDSHAGVVKASYKF